MGGQTRAMGELIWWEQTRGRTVAYSNITFPFQGEAFKWSKLVGVAYIHPNAIPYIQAGITDTALIDQCIETGVDSSLAVSIMRAR